MKISSSILIILFLLSCSNRKSSEEKINGQTFFVKDTISSLIIQHCDITVCLDAEIVSGKLYYPKAIIESIKVEKRFIPNQHDLYLIGKENLSVELFDSILNPKMGNKYLVKGNVVGYKSYGTIFNVQSYKRIE